MTAKVVYWYSLDCDKDSIVKTFLYMIPSLNERRLNLLTPVILHIPSAWTRVVKIIQGGIFNDY